MVKTSACDGFSGDYSAFLDGELDGDLEAGRAAQMRAHVADCAHCAAELEALSSVDLLLRAAPAPVVPTDLGARLHARIAEQELRAEVNARPTSGLDSRDRRPPVRAPRVRTAMPRPPRRASLRIGSAAKIGAAAAIAAALALFLLQTGTREERERLPVVVAVAQPTDDSTLDLLDLADSSDREVIELAVVLELDTLEDLDVIANLELLERLIALEEGTG